MKKNTIFSIGLILIFVFALLIRLYKIDALPLYADETSGHYLYWNEFMYNRVLSIQFIKDVLFSFVWLFGLSPLGVRSASAFYGALGVIAIYTLALKASGKQSVALISAILTAVLPWNYMISRLGHTHMPIIVVLVCLQVYFFIRAKKIRDYLLSAVIILVGLFYYPSMAVITPIVLLVILYYAFQVANFKQRRIISVVIITCLSFALVLFSKNYQLFSPQGRALDLAIWRDVNTSYDTDRYRGLTWNFSPSLLSFYLPPEQLANKLFLNRITANLTIFAKNYLSFFSPAWLFLQGDAILRHSTGLVGTFYPFLIPFIPYGAYRFFSKADKKTKNLFLVWILVSPIPAAITKDGAGYLLRVVTMLPFLTYFCALGLVDSFRLIKSKLRIFYGIAIALIALYSVWYFFYGYFHIYPAISGHAYESGFKELSDFQVNHDKEIMLIIWDGYYPYGNFLFWQKTPFSEYKKMTITPIGIGETTFWQTLPNLYFVNPKQTVDMATFIDQYRPVYIVFPDRYFVKWSDDLLNITDKKVSQIDYLDKTPAFTIYTLKPD